MTYTIPLPNYDGEVVRYRPIGCPPRSGIRFYYVNGIDNQPKDHATTAQLVADITESVVWGIYNQTNGLTSDLSQCIGDWARIVQSQLGEEGFWRDRLTQSAIDAITRVSIPMSTMQPILHSLRELLVAPQEVVQSKVPIARLRQSLHRNPAAFKLFDELGKHRGSRQIVVAHSQGNLVTSLALWALQAAYGSQALVNIQIRSVSSPAPAWPRGINHRIKVYGQRDDLVTWADPKNWIGARSEGFWRNYFVDYIFDRQQRDGQKKKLGVIAPHGASFNIVNTSLYMRLRDDAGLAKFRQK